MFFTVLNSTEKLPLDRKRCVYLRTDYWDDWRKYRTMFTLHVIDAAGHVHDIGSVKIGQAGLRPGAAVEPGQRAPELPSEFDSLDHGFFSLGQGEDYYAALGQLDDGLGREVFKGLRDCAHDLSLFDAYLNEYVMEESLLRDVSRQTVRSRFHRLSVGNAQLTKFQFEFTLRHPQGIDPPLMSFDVIPESNPPSNVHVLIGRNGVGKTNCMRQLALTLLGRADTEGNPFGQVALIPVDGEEWAFSGLVMVSFSAFDAFDLQPAPQDTIPAHQVGLRHHVEVAADGPSSDNERTELSKDFRQSLERCRQGLRAARWQRAIEMLEVDDLFAEAQISALLGLLGDDIDDWRRRAEDLFERLSSGHAIVLLTITRLVELVDEKTLVLLDEPEGHLHPPLLSAFVRCLSDLLVQRNGVAIVATHSPVVLQEVPRSAAWKLRRSRAVSVVERPTIETFGENISLLTREVFGLEVTRSGYHSLLANVIEAGGTYEDVLNHFDQQLGQEARAIVRSLIAARDEV